MKKLLFIFLLLFSITVYGQEFVDATDPSSWNVIMSENFENSFPSSGWDSFYNSGYTNAYWDKVNNDSHTGSYSAWCAAGGTNKVSPTLG